MKTSIEFLPLEKQTEINKAVDIIKNQVQPEMIILFGNYARNEWVEDMYDDKQYRYQSDLDILVIVETKSEAIQNRLEIEIQHTLKKNEAIKTPVSIIVHDIDFVNRRLTKAQYFFTDIKKEGIRLYDSGKYVLKEARELLPAERKKLALEDFNYWFKKANEMMLGFKFYYDQNYDVTSAFMLHQVTERLYSGILFVFTRYRPNTHDIDSLRKISNSVDGRLIPVFPMDNKQDEQLFELLRKAYVDARYNPNYKITHDELFYLHQRVGELKKVGEFICQEKMGSFVN